jgi:NADH dehydrogenase FAD-containing subunit
MAEVRAIDATTRRVQIDSLSIPYDYLVLATGAAHCYFGSRGMGPSYIRDRRRRWNPSHSSIRRLTWT